MLLYRTTNPNFQGFNPISWTSERNSSLKNIFRKWQGEFDKDQLTDKL